MQNDEERWQAIEAMVDDHLDGEAGPEADTTWADDDGGLRRRVVSFLDAPLGAGFGDLLGVAMEAQSIPALRSGEEVGPYRIDGVIGEGGMGTVFLARRVDGNFDQVVALKLLHRGPADDKARRRFLQERQILAGLRHPHIARLLDGGVTRGMPYLVMERVDGPSISEFCRTQELGREERIRLFLQACDAIRYAHRQGVIHRDLKPSNLLVEEGPHGEARVVVLDFGIALVEHSEVDVTATGQIFGTPGYMSPEQAFGSRQEIDRRSDIFSLGVLLHELLSDRRPFSGDTPHEVLQQIQLGEPTPLGRHLPGVSVDLSTIVETCLASQPARRYDSVRALVEDLESYLDGAPIAARPVGWLGRWLLRARRRPKIAALIAGALAVTLVSLVALVAMAIGHARALAVERNAAIAARRDAEGLLDFMLEDLHHGLERLGRLDLLEQVARKSLAYYERRPSGEETADLEGRAAALHNAGQILEEQGAMDRALDAYGRSLRLWERLQIAEPGPGVLLELARLHEAIGSGVSFSGEIDQAKEHVDHALSLSRRLGARPSPPPGWAEVHFDCLATSGWLEQEHGTVAAAVSILEEARTLAADQAETAAEGTADAWRHRQAVAYSYLGLVDYQEGNLTAALANFEPARQQCLELVEKDPGNNVWREEYQLVLGRIGSTLLDLDDLEAAIPVLEEARRQSQILLEVEPNNGNWLRELSVIHAVLAAAHQGAGHLPLALESIEESLAISRTLTRRYPENHSSMNDLAWDLLDLGRIRRDLGDDAGAARAWTEAVDVMRQIRSQVADSSYYLDTELQALVELGRLDEARPLARQLHGAGWKTPDFLSLCEEYGLGPHDPAALAPASSP